MKRWKSTKWSCKKKRTNSRKTKTLSIASCPELERLFQRCPQCGRVPCTWLLHKVKKMFGQQESNNIIEDQRICAAAIYEDQPVSYSTAQIIGVRSATVSCSRSMVRQETQAHRCTALSSSCSIAFPSSRIFPKWSCATKTFTLIIVLLTVMLPANLVHSATFFYGATDDSQNLPAPAAGASSELSKYSSGSKLSEDDLKSVYTFCSLLPMLESSGRIEKNNQSREICEKLIVMLQPMFAKRRSSTPVTTKQRRSIFNLEDVK